MLLLDAAAVTASLSPGDAVEAITSALAAGFDPASDTARRTAPTSRGHLLLMPSEVGAYAGVKVATVAPDNPAAGLPRIQASYLIFDAATLTLQAILDGTALTTVRTPAVSVAAVRPYLNRGDRPARLVLFGAGPQAVGHAYTLSAVVDAPFAAVTFVVRRPERVGSAARARGAVLRSGTSEALAALAAADVVVCATSARTPLFPADAVRPEAVVVAVGSHEPDARELDGALLARSLVIVEDIGTALREAGDVVLATDEGAIDEGQLTPMKDVVTDPAPSAEGRPVVFKSSGMSWEDLVIAQAVFARSTATMSADRCG